MAYRRPDRASGRFYGSDAAHLGGASLSSAFVTFDLGEHLAVIVGAVSAGCLPLHVHVKCLTGDVFYRRRVPLRQELNSMARMSAGAAAWSCISARTRASVRLARQGDARPMSCRRP